MNALDKAVSKAWNLREQQMKDIVSQAQLSYQWIFEVLASAKESVDSNSAWMLPKTPCLKKRKLEPEPEEEVPVLEEAKKPRKLKRNANDTKRKASNSRRASTKAKSKSTIKPPRASTRITRANAKACDLNGSHFNPGNEKSILEEKEGDIQVQEIEQISNTTKSFCEHEADLEVTDVNVTKETNNEVPSEKCNLTFNLGDTTAKDVKTSKVLSANLKAKEQLHNEKETEQFDDHIAETLQSKNNDQEPKIAPQLITNIDGSHASPMQQEIINQKSSSACKGTNIDALIVSSPKIKHPLFAKQSPNHHLGVSEEHNTPPLNKSTTKSSKLMPENTEEAVQSPKAVMPQIARIKERLFEKIKSPANGNAKQSTRLTGKGKSPARVVNTPDNLNSPASKRKIVCTIDFEDSPEKIKVSAKQTSTPAKESSQKQVPESEGDCVENGCTEELHDDQTVKSKGPKLFKPIKPKNVLSGVHTIIKAANQKTEVVQGPVAKQNNVATGIFSFIKSNAPSKAESVEERKLRLEEDVKKREESRKKLVEQAELRRQKEMDDRKKRRQEREQRVADAQAKKAQAEEERIRMAQERFELLKKNDERARKQKEKEEETKRKIRERKMAEAEAKRQNEEIERQTKIAEKEEEEKRKAEYLQRKHEFEEQERKRKIEEQKRIEEERLENCARERQLQEERIRREIEEREMQQKKRLEERLLREKEEKEIQEKKRMEKERQEKEVHERVRREREMQERIQREKELERLERERREEQAREYEKKQKEAKELERKQKEAKEREAKEKEARDAYYKKKLEQKQAAEAKRTFDKTEMQNKQAAQTTNAKKIMPAPHIPTKVQCTSYKTPTLSKVKPKVDKTKPLSLLTYDIVGLSEDDSTDDDEDPAQEIPSWAKGDNLKGAIIRQIKSELDPYDIFVNMLEPPKLEKMFPKLRARFFKRTSSAHWEQPPRPFKTML